MGGGCGRTQTECREGGEEMKCPLLTAGMYADPTVKGDMGAECYKEECAWWNITNNECAILQLSKSIYYMGVEIAAIEQKMPYGKKDTK